MGGRPQTGTSGKLTITSLIQNPSPRNILLGKIGIMELINGKKVPVKTEAKEKNLELLCNNPSADCP